MSLLEVRGLVKRYGDRTVVNNVSYRVDAGEIVGLLGPNGAGKTTTFRMTVGMIVPAKGKVTLGGKDITRLPMHRRARLGMGYLSQEPSIFRHMTVTENLLAVMEARGLKKRERTERADELLAEFGLEHVATSRSVTLSGGERRRLELARTLSLDPTLILLDEPFSGVDPIAVEDIQEQLRRLRDRGIAILITDHAVRETLGTTDRAYIIYEGRIFRHGDANSLADDPQVRAVYLGEKFTLGDEAVVLEELEDEEGVDEGHPDDEQPDAGHSDDEHSEDEHSEDEHSEDEHSEDEHSDGEHSDGGPADDDSSDDDPPADEPPDEPDDGPDGAPPGKPLPPDPLTEAELEELGDAPPRVVERDTFVDDDVGPASDEPRPRARTRATARKKTAAAPKTTTKKKTAAAPKATKRPTKKDAP